MTPEFVVNKNIDRVKWDETVLRNGPGRMYFLSAYLDATCKDWHALVFGDYEVIMPLPCRSYWVFGLRHDIPLYVQQLGIIGLREDQKDLKEQFIIESQNLYRKYIYSFCHENVIGEIEGSQIIHRTNYELNLNQSYAEIKKGYSNNLNRNLKSASANGLIFKKLNSLDILESFIVNHSKKDDPSPRKINTIREIYNINHPSFETIIFAVFQGDQAVAVCLAPRFQNRITLLIPRSNDEGRRMNAMALLIDQIIQSNAGTDMILDFEGSMLPGVAQFYKSFGAVDRPYGVISG